MKFENVIIGNSSAAIGCVEAIREIDSDADILMVSADRQAYSRALIPYYLRGKIELEGLLYRRQEFFERLNVETKFGIRVERIDTNKKEITLENGEIVGYEKLLIATGGKPFIPKIEGLNARDFFTFQTLEDVLRIKEAVEKAESAVILGAGIIGLMLAEALVEKGLEVKVVELADRVLAPVLDKKTSEIVQRKFAEKGVEILLNNTILEVRRNEKKILRLKDGREIETDLLAIAVGVVPNAELAKNAGIKVNRGIVVNKRMETSVKDVYAAGDCVEIFDSIAKTSRPIPLWITAYMGGRIAGFNMSGIPRDLSFVTAMNSMHFFDYYIITAGLSNSEDGEVISRLEGENYRRFVLRDGKIVGFIIAGKVGRAGIFTRLMEEELEVSGFKDKLLNDNFGYVDIPEAIRWNLLKEKVKFGVVRDAWI
ncbi:MAG: FAD-dependent oxidoreductase [Archaeoglobales archaeon]|nr:FAD-dependent oxidoreductase [Archaeoglobales archaeon]